MTAFNKILIFIFFLLSSSASIANGLQFQIIDKDIQLTKQFVQNIEIDPKHPKILRLILTEEGNALFNKLILNSYDKKLSIIFNDKIITAGIEIKTFELSNNDLDLVTPDEDTAKEIFSYLNHR